jgi:vitamin B12 transporter
MFRFYHTSSLIIALLILPLVLQAQRSLHDDTLRYTLPGDIVVNALRIPSSVANATVPISVYSHTDIQRSPANSVSDLLRFSAGTSIRAYGGGGSLDLVSLRGLEAEYTVVLLDGVRLNTAQIGTVDLDKISLHAIERIEVARGGYSSLYGSDALGGIVSITSSEKVQKTYVKGGGGSFGWQRYEAGSGLLIGRTALSFSGLYEEAQNDFSFSQPGARVPVIYTRERSNYTSKGISFRGRTAFASSSLSMLASINSTDAGTPGEMSGVHQGFARQQDNTTVLSFPYRLQLSPRVLVQATASVLHSVQKYFDATYRINGKALDSEYRNLQYGLSVSADHQLHDALRMVYGSDLQYAILRSNAITGNPERMSAGFYATAEWTLDPEHKRFRVLPSLRADLIKDNNSRLHDERLSPSIAMHYRLLPEWLAVWTRYSMGYRVPTFNQLYWVQGGNPELKAETSGAIDGGLRFTTPWVRNLSLDLGYFRHDISNKIVWRPSHSIFWSPLNIRDVVSHGIETSISYSGFRKRLHLDANAQWISSQQANEEFPGDLKKGKQLIYVPEYSGSIRITGILYNELAISVGANFAGKRYYTSTNDKHLAPYMLFDAAITQSIQFGDIIATLKAEALNVFNSLYQATAFYPMPGRAFRITMTTQLQ